MVDNQNREKLQSENTIVSIFKLSWPVMVGTILQTLVYTGDLFFVSKLGTMNASAASLGTSAAGVVFVMSALISSGTIAIAARGYGENNWEKIKSATGNGLILAILFGMAVGLLGQFGSAFIIKKIYGVTDINTFELTSKYLNIVLGGTAFVFVNFSMRSVLQGVGDTLSPLFIFGLCNVLNIILDPILIFGLDMGIAGAAIATVISMAVGSVLVVIRVKQKILKTHFSAGIKYLKLSGLRVLQILKIGIWACIQQTARPITGMLMFAIVLRAGGNAGSAAFGIGGQLFNYTFIFLSGLSVAVSILIGQAMGRNDLESLDKIIHRGLKLGVINMVLFAIPYIIFPEGLFKLFLSDPQVISIGVRYLRIIYLGLIFVVFPVIYGGVFQGAGDTRPAMTASLVANVVFKVPCAWFLVNYFKMGIDGVWWAIAGSVYVEAIIGRCYIRKGLWKDVKLR